MTLWVRQTVDHQSPAPKTTGDTDGGLRIIANKRTIQVKHTTNQGSDQEVQSNEIMIRATRMITTEVTREDGRSMIQIGTDEALEIAKTTGMMTDTRVVSAHPIESINTTVLGNATAPLENAATDILTTIDTPTETDLGLARQPTLEILSNPVLSCHLRAHAAPKPLFPHNKMPSLLRVNLATLSASQQKSRSQTTTPRASLRLKQTP